MTIENSPSEEEVDTSGLTEEERAIVEGFEGHFPDKNLPENERRDCEPEIMELQKMFGQFEIEYGLDELSAITDLRLDNKDSEPIREPARVALIAITEQMNKLKQETNISSEQYEELNEQYQKFWKAVGVFKFDKLTHE